MYMYVRVFCSITLTPVTDKQQRLSRGRAFVPCVRGHGFKSAPRHDNDVITSVPDSSLLNAHPTVIVLASRALFQQWSTHEMISI